MEMDKKLAKRLMWSLIIILSVTFFMVNPQLFPKLTGLILIFLVGVFGIFIIVAIICFLVGVPVYLICRLFKFTLEPFYVLFKRILDFLMGLLAFKFITGRAKNNQEKMKMANEEERLGKEKRKIIENLGRINQKNPEIAEDANLQFNNVFADESLDMVYKGFWGEKARRFGMDQLRKSVESKQKLLEEMSTYVQQLVTINTSMAQLAEARVNYEVTQERTKIKQEQLKSGAVRELAELEMETQKLEALQKKINAEMAISSLMDQKAEMENKEKIEEISDEEKDRKLEEVARRRIASTDAIKMAQDEGRVQRAIFQAQQERKIREEFPEDADRIIEILEQKMAREDDGE